MNEKVFISGSIAIKRLPQIVCSRLENIMAKNMWVLVGDAQGIDILIQNFFEEKNYYNIIVYSIYQNPRNLRSQKFQIQTIDVPDDVKKERERQHYKDKQMSEDSDYSLVIWDGESKGSFSNIIRALELNKKIVVYLSREQRFIAQDKCTIPEIEFIYRKYHGYTSSEIFEYLQRERIGNFDKIQDFNNFLITNKIIVKNEKKKYEPCPELSQEKIDRYFIKTKYKGKETGINYTNDLIEWIEKEVKTLSIYECSSKQESLF